MNLGMFEKEKGDKHSDACATCEIILAVVGAVCSQDAD